MYHSVNPAVLERIPAHARSILDLGCGSGTLGAQLKATRSCTVAGVTHDAQEAASARRALDGVQVADLDAFTPDGLGRFDCVVCSHVLEHLQQPERLLRALHACLGDAGTLVVALPNALYWKQRVEFMRGRFRYTEGGLMDRTHLRFFDWHTAAQLIEDAGYALTARHADGHLPLSRWLGRRLAATLDRRGTDALPGLLGHQFVFTARCVSPGTR